MALYSARNFSNHAFPYLTTYLEYPVGIGLIAGTVGLVSSNLAQFFWVNSLILVVAAWLIFRLLQRLRPEPSRLAFFVFAPTLILYAFLNWDLLAILFMVAGLAAFQNRRDGFAGFWLGLGAATKLFPGFLVPGLLLVRYLQKKQLSWRLMAGAVAGFLLLNLPIYLINPARWWYPWQFQGTRFPNFETSWFFIYHHFGSPLATSFWWTTYPRLTSYLSLTLFALALAVILWREWRSRRPRPFVLAFVTLTTFLLTAKVFSPQYLLWLLPFFVLLPFPSWAIWGFFGIDLLSWAAIAHFLPVANTVAGNRPLILLELMVTLRYLWLVLLMYLTLQFKEPE